MSPFLVAVLLACVASQSFASNVSVSTCSTGGVFAPGDLMFQDEFDSLDLNKWHHEVTFWGGGNGEFQIYNKNNENTYVRDGLLVIKPSLTIDRLNGNYEELYNGYLELEGCTGEPCSVKANYPNILPPVFSGRLRTKGSFSFHYGKVVARAQLPSGDWTWPAIWMLPENSVYGGWPRSGEIDIMESRGNRKLTVNGVNIGSEQVGSTLHFGPQDTSAWWAATGSTNTAADQGFDRDFHIYELEWTPSYLKFSVDGREFKTINPPGGGFFELGAFDNNIPNPWNGADNFHLAPFDQNFHLILNVAVGGTFFPGNSNPPPVWLNTGKPNFLSFMDAVDSWKGTWTGENHAMKIDYIRVYAI